MKLAIDKFSIFCQTADRIQDSENTIVKYSSRLHFYLSDIAAWSHNYHEILVHKLCFYPG